MSIAERTVNGAPEWYDTNTNETIDRVASLKFADDFIRHRDYRISRARLDSEEQIGAAGLDGELVEPLFDAYPNASDGGLWDTIETACPDIELTQDGSGYATLSVTAADLTQLSALYWSDAAVLNAGNDLTFEARVCLSTLPTGAGGELTSAFIGLAGTHNATANSIRTSAWFRAEGSGEIFLEADDNTTDRDGLQSGETFTAGVWHILKLRCYGGQAYFTIDGEAVGSLAFSPLERLQPYFRVSKTRSSSNTSYGTLNVDYCRVWWAR